MLQKYLVWEISTYGNTPGDESKVLAEDDKSYYYNDGFGRYCYVEKSKEGAEFTLTVKEKQRRKKKVTCTWQVDDESENNFWNTECGTEFFFYSGTPEENEFKYCPFCGRYIETQESVE